MAPVPNALKSDLKKPGFVPFGANLTQFEAKPTIPANVCGCRGYTRLVGVGVSLA